VGATRSVSRVENAAGHAWLARLLGNSHGTSSRRTHMEPVAPALASSRSEAVRNHAAFIWSVADLLRGDYKQSEYGKVILQWQVIRRLDCVLEPTKQAILDKHRQLAGRIENLEPVLQAVAGQQFYNTSPLTFTKLLDDPNTIADSLQLYIGGFSATAKDVI